MFPSGNWKRETLSLYNLWQQQVATAKRFPWIELAICWCLTWKRTVHLQAWLFEKAWEISCQLVRASDRSWNRETHEKVVRLGKSEWFIRRIALSSFWAKRQFLETPRNVSGPKPNFGIKTCWIVAQFLAHKPVNFASFSDNFNVSFSKLLKLSSWIRCKGGNL